MLLTFAAYWAAIGLKGVVQFLTYNSVVNAFGYQSIPTALYLGLQTVFFEVGLAYVFARYSSRRRGVTSGDAVAYSLGLSFWENGILLGVFSLFQLIVIYAILSAGGNLAAMVASELPGGYSSAPEVALKDVSLGTLERTSSILIPTAWGILCVLSATTGRKRFVAVALPMGLVDAAVPFASVVSLYVFEGAIFMVSLLCFGIAWSAFKSASSRFPPADAGSPTTRLG